MHPILLSYEAPIRSNLPKKEERGKEREREREREKKRERGREREREREIGMIMT